MGSMTLHLRSLPLYQGFPPTAGLSIAAIKSLTGAWWYLCAFVTTCRICKYIPIALPIFILEKACCLNIKFSSLYCGNGNKVSSFCAHLMIWNNDDYMTVLKIPLKVWGPLIILFPAIHRDKQEVPGLIPTIILSCSRQPCQRRRGKTFIEPETHVAQPRSCTV